VTKKIWVPESETKVTVQDGEVYVSTQMIMIEKKIKTEIGFKDENKSDRNV